MAWPLMAPLDASAAAKTQLEALAAILEVELLLEFAYQHVLHLDVLTPAAGQVTTAFLVHERAHKQVITSWLLGLGGTPPAPLDLRAAGAALSTHQVSGSLEQLSSQKDALSLLGEIEAVAEGAYYVGMSSLTNHQLLASAVQIMANEAQHATMLSELLHPGDVGRAVPAAFVQGVP